MSKGSKRRPQQVSQQEFDVRWDRVFSNCERRKKPNKRRKPTVQQPANHQVNQCGETENNCGTIENNQ
jgi:hypothetical protein